MSPGSWNLFRAPELHALAPPSWASQAVSMLLSPLPSHQKALHICFGCKTHLHRVHINILFPPASSTVRRHCICMITYHRFPLRRKWSLSSHVMVLLSTGHPFRQLFSFIIHRLHQPFCCIWSPKFYFFEP